MNNNLKEDLDNFLKEKIDPIARKHIEKEAISFNNFIDKHQDKYEKLKNNHSQFIWQIITLEGVIFGGVMLFQDKSDVSLYLLISLFLLILSITMGVILHRLRIDSDYWSHDFRYRLRKDSNEFTRKLWKDVVLDWEKEIIKNSEYQEPKSKNGLINKILNTTHLTQERIEFIFISLFISSLLFLFIHAFSQYSSNEIIKNKFMKCGYQYSRLRF